MKILIESSKRSIGLNTLVTIDPEMEGKRIRSYRIPARNIHDAIRKISSAYQSQGYSIASFSIYHMHDDTFIAESTMTKEGASIQQ